MASPMVGLSLHVSLPAWRSLWILSTSSRDSVTLCRSLALVLNRADNRAALIASVVEACSSLVEAVAGGQTRSKFLSIQTKYIEPNFSPGIFPRSIHLFSVAMPGALPDEKPTLLKSEIFILFGHVLPSVFIESVPRIRMLLLGSQ